MTTTRDCILQLLQQTAHYFNEQRQQAYLVGGSLRNLLLGEPSIDWDIVTSGDAPSLARRLANKLGGHYAHLHAKASRVVVFLEDEESHKQESIFDIAPVKGDSLEADLRQRDFTINALAAPLDDVIRLLEHIWHSQWLTTHKEHPSTSISGPQENVVAPLVHPVCTLFGEEVLTGNARSDPTSGATSPATFATTFASSLIDPLHGLADIEARRLKAVDSNIFRHDPLRVLRAVRLMARYQLGIDNWTEGLLMRDAALLPQVAPERVHDELYAILGPDGATQQLRFLDAHGLLTVLVPEFIPARGMLQPSPHYWDVLEHSLETVGMLERLAALVHGEPEEIRQSPLERGEQGYLAEIGTLLQEAEQQGIFQRALLVTPAMKLAALLHDIGKPVTYATDEEGAIHFYGHPQAGVPLAQQVMKRLSASTRDRRLVQQVVAHHMRPGQLAQVSALTPRAIRRYFVDLGPTGIAIALFSLADHLATRGPLPLNNSWETHLAFVYQLLTAYIRQRESILPPHIISAGELMRRFKLEPGPQVGMLLEQIAEARAEGLVHSKEEAFWLAEEKLLIR